MFDRIVRRLASARASVMFEFDLEGGNVATAWNLKVNKSKRHRVYCFMPVIDSVPVAPETYVRKFKSWCAKQPFLKGLVK